jgi:hypothetical protein
VHVEARERVAARVHQPVGQRVHQRRHGGGAGTGTLFLVLCGGGTRCPSPPCSWGREEELWWVRGRGLGPAGPLATKWAGY